jgi:predicted HTH domain antitoxin
MLVLEDDFVKAFDLSDSEIKLEIAVLLFQQGKVSSRKAASLAGISFLKFWKELSKRGIDLISDKTYVDSSGELIL